MKTKPATVVLALVSLLAVKGLGQNTNQNQTLEAEKAPEPWALTASLYGYVVPESRDYVNPNFTADHGRVHLEARYNYEALETGSAWVGYNFSFGEKLICEFTPMLGGVFGNLTGVAPGYNLLLNYKKLTLSSQSEYFVDAGDASANFFYTWSELTFSPWDWFRAGLAVQRTKAYQSDLDIQRGFVVGLSYGKCDLATYVFNLGWTDPTLVLAFSAAF